jgi:hypothetical protein
MDKTPKKQVATAIDDETAKSLGIIEKVLEIKPAAVVRRALRAEIPKLLKQVKAASK